MTMRIFIPRDAGAVAVGAAEAEDGREDEQSVEIEAVFIEVGFDAQQAQGNRQD